MLELRSYRKNLENGKFKSFTAKFKETDLWIGVDKGAFKHEMRAFALEQIKYLRKQIEDYAKKDTFFLESLTPYTTKEGKPQIIKKMFNAGEKAGVGPMASVAGAFAYEIGGLMESEFKLKDIIVENGGDIYLNARESIIVSIFAGRSPLSEKIGIRVSPEYSPIGICTSSGTVGHSLSFGKADAVVIICKDPAIADAYATLFCNMVRREEDIENVLSEIKGVKEIMGALIVFGERVGIIGNFPLEILNS